MDIRTDSVDDVLCHYGITPGAGREYINGIITHGLFGIPTEREKAEMEEKQRIADARLQRAQKIKKQFDHYITEYESFLPRLRDLENQIWTTANDIGKSKYPNEADYNELSGLHNRCNSIYKSINQRFITESEEWGQLNNSRPILDRVKEFHSLCNSYESAFTLGKRLYEEAQRRKEKLDAIHSSQTEYSNHLRRENGLSKIGRNKK